MLGFFKHWHHAHHHAGRHGFHDHDAHEAFAAMGRGHRHPGGFGFDPRGGFGEGGRGFGAGRKLSGSDLQLLLLALLAEQPRHGYELIKALDERSSGYYVPSPGVIYPALNYLEEADLAEVELEGTKKRYRLTAAGQAHLADRRAAADAMLEQLSHAGERMERARRALHEDGPGEEWLGRFHHGHRQRHALHAAMHDIKAALRERFGRGGAGEEELREVMELLRATAAAIRGGER
jgi:DNA-binding PadR family transcriptional regulator